MSEMPRSASNQRNDSPVVPIFFRERNATIVFEFLEFMHSVPSRAYHNLNHVHQCINALELLVPDKPPAEAIASIWFHDCVYVPGSAHNELASSAIAQAYAPLLGFDSEGAQTIGRAVMATRSHTPHETGVPAMVVDADLSILGAEPIAYASYTEAIREEWRHVAPDAFNRGRLAFVRNMLSREQLFATARGRECFEEAATRNLRAEAEQLEKLVPGL